MKICISLGGCSIDIYRSMDNLSSIGRRR